MKKDGTYELVLKLHKELPVVTKRPLRNERLKILTSIYASIYNIPKIYQKRNFDALHGNV